MQSIGNFNIHVNPLNEQNTFSSGDLVTGYISFELTKKTNVTSITMSMKGMAHVHWSTGSGGKRRRSRHKSAKLDFFGLEGVILQDRFLGYQQHYSLARTCIRLHVSYHRGVYEWALNTFIAYPTVNRRSIQRQLNLPGQVGKIPDQLMVLLWSLSGSYYHEMCFIQRSCRMFTDYCYIFRDFPTSFQELNGQISYTLTVSIHRPWRMTKDRQAQLKFVNRIDTNQPVLWAPLSGFNSMTVCGFNCTSGPITMKVGTEKKAFSPGETVKIICDFSNASSHTVSPKLKMLQKHTFSTINRSSNIMRFKKLAFLNAHPINAHTSLVHDEFTLTVPSVASPSISNCRILKVEHLIEVSLTLMFYPDLVVLVPIVIFDSVNEAQHNLNSV